MTRRGEPGVAERGAAVAAPASMLARFEGDRGKQLLIEALRSQLLVQGDAELAADIAAKARLRELEVSDHLIRQDHVDNDLFFVLSGAFRVFINGREVAMRETGTHVGEMAIINPAARRSASVVACEPSVVACLDEATFVAIAHRYPRIWLHLARELSKRLDERRKFHRPPNTKTVLFIGSSSEQLPYATLLRDSIDRDKAAVTLWSEGVFGASNFPIDDLETQVKIADLAVLVVGADDHLVSRGKESDAPRDNVVFELGLFMGALSRARTFLLAPHGLEVKIPTDLLGLTTLRFDPKAASPNDAVAAAATEISTLIEKLGPK